MAKAHVPVLPVSGAALCHCLVPMCCSMAEALMYGLTMSDSCSGQGEHLTAALNARKCPFALQRQMQD